MNGTRSITYIVIQIFYTFKPCTSTTYPCSHHYSPINSAKFIPIKRPPQPYQTPRWWTEKECWGRENWRTVLWRVLLELLETHLRRILDGNDDTLKLAGAVAGAVPSASKTNRARKEKKDMPKTSDGFPSYLMAGRAKGLCVVFFHPPRAIMRNYGTTLRQHGLIRANCT